MNKRPKVKCRTAFSERDVARITVQGHVEERQVDEKEIYEEGVGLKDR